MLWNKKKPALEKHYPLISNAIGENQTVHEIYEMLLSINVHLSYSTVARAVTLLKSKQKNEVTQSTPGQEAEVFFIQLGKFRKGNMMVDSYLFILQLSFSKYSYGQLVKEQNFERFLNCHAKAFECINGVPVKINTVCTNAFDLDNPDLHARYSYFLYRCGTSLSPHSFCRNKSYCDQVTRTFKKSCISHILPKRFSVLPRQIKQWIETEINLQRHPKTGQLIKIEFQTKEQPRLLPYKKRRHKNQ